MSNDMQASGADPQDLRFLSEIADASAWIETVATAVIKMNESRLGRLTSLIPPWQPSLGGLAMQTLTAWEHTLSQIGSAKTAPAIITRTREQAIKTLGELEALLDRFEERPAWRLGLLLRTLTGIFGLKKMNYRMPGADARVALAQFRHWTWIHHAEPGELPANGALPESEAISDFGETLYAESMQRIVANCARPTFSFGYAVSSAGARRRQVQKSHSTPKCVISIIMPTYNRAFVITEAVRSVLEQTWQNWELLICDDGSTDNTKQIVEAFSDPRIVHLPLPHRGAAAARNAGIRGAQGSLVAFLDTDNIWHPYYLEAMHNLLAATPSAPFAYATYVDVLTKDGAPAALRPLRPRYYSFEQLTECNYIDLNTSVYRREVIRENGGFDERLSRFQDWDLALKHAFGKRPTYLNLALCIYRRNTDWSQISQNKKSASIAEQIVAQNLSDRYARTSPHSTELRSLAEARVAARERLGLDQNDVVVAVLESPNDDEEMKAFIALLHASGYHPLLVRRDAASIPFGFARSARNADDVASIGTSRALMLLADTAIYYWNPRSSTLDREQRAIFAELLAVGIPVFATPVAELAPYALAGALIPLHYGDLPSILAKLKEAHKDLATTSTAATRLFQREFSQEINVETLRDLISQLEALHS